ALAGGRRVAAAPARQANEADNPQHQDHPALRFRHAPRPPRHRRRQPCRLVHIADASHRALPPGTNKAVDGIERILRDIRADSNDDDDDTSPDAPTTWYYYDRGVAWSTANYSLGPRVTRWNAKRRRWFHLNPGFPSRDVRGRPRILLVTASPSGPCDTGPAGDHFLLKATKNKIDYCRLHGVELAHITACLDDAAKLAGAGGTSFRCCGGPAADVGPPEDGVAVVGGRRRARHRHGVRAPVGALQGHPPHRPQQPLPPLQPLLLGRRQHRQLPAPHLPVVAGPARRLGRHGVQRPRTPRRRQAAHGGTPWPPGARGCKPCIGGGRPSKGGGGKSGEEYSLLLDRCARGMEHAFNFADNQVLRLL
ncbi:unnamed protein product, partial [Urochloa humidicola]